MIQWITQLFSGQQSRDRSSHRQHTLLYEDLCQ